MKTPFPNIRAIADSEAAQRLHAAAKPTLTVRDLCVRAGVPMRSDGKIPIAALDKALKITGWSVEKRMEFKEEYKQFIA